MVSDLEYIIEPAAAHERMLATREPLVSKNFADALIYLMWCGDEVVFVGASTNVYSRVFVIPSIYRVGITGLTTSAYHEFVCKPADYEFDKYDMEMVVDALIAYYKPVFNRLRNVPVYDFAKCPDLIRLQRDFPPTSGDYYER